jgi:hypothetical protein
MRPAPYPRLPPTARLVFSDLAEQPGLSRGGGALLLHKIVGETASLENYGAQLGDAAAIRVVKVHKRKPGPGHRVL